MMTRPAAGRLVVCSETPSWELPQEIFKGSCRLGNTSKSADVAQYAENCILFGDGTVASWVRGDEDATYKGFTFKKPLMLSPPPEVERIVKIASGFHYFLALREDGEVFVWGDEKWKKDKDLSLPNGRLQGIKDIDIDRGGGMHAVTFEGKVVSWGNKKSSEMYDYITTKHPKNLKDVVRIHNAVGFTKSGELISWAVSRSGDAYLELPKGLQKVRDIVSKHYFSLAIQQNGKVVEISGNPTRRQIIDREFGSLKQKVTQAALTSGAGIVLLFENGTIQYFDFHEEFRDCSSNSDFDYRVNGEKVANVLSIGGLDTGFWAILEEGKTVPNKAKTIPSNKKK